MGQHVHHSGSSYDYADFCCDNCHSRADQLLFRRSHGGCVRAIIPRTVEFTVFPHFLCLSTIGCLFFCFWLLRRSTLYNWRTPIGFVVLVFHQTFWSCIVLDFIISAFFFFCAMCMCLIDCSTDINCTLRMLDEDIKSGNLAASQTARIEFKRKFNDAIDFHASSIR